MADEAQGDLIPTVAAKAADDGSQAGENLESKTQQPPEEPLPKISGLALIDPNAAPKSSSETDSAKGTGIVLAGEAETVQSLALRKRYKKQFVPLERVIAIVIDDIGVNYQQSLEAVQLEGVYTLSFLTYGQHIALFSDLAAKQGHEIFIHQGAEPMSEANPGPDALYVGMDETDIRKQIQQAHAKFPQATGVNNHMGSRFNRWNRGVDIMLEEINAKDMIFLDSFTDKSSQALYRALQHNYAALGRDVFIDVENTPDFIDTQLQQTRKIAEKQGFAIAIAHPYVNTLERLPQWQSQLQEEGFRFVTISELWKMLTENKPS